MAEDIESNFWKEHFTHLQHKNMVRTDAKRLSFEEVPFAIEEFTKQNPQFEGVTENHGSYITWETFVTDQIKLRLYFQYQIKGSLLQQQQNDFVKIADAKFPYNPFFEVAEFLSRKDQYISELEKEKTDALKSNMEIKLAGEFIKAYLKNRLEKYPHIIWNLQPTKENFILVLQNEKVEKTYTLGFKNFISEINAIDLDKM